jgi:hypothetical protein
MAKDFTEIKGFEELNAKLKKLPDTLKRKEVLGLQKEIAKPLIDAYKNALPLGKKDKIKNGTSYPKGTLKESVSAVTVPASKVGGNPSVVIRPGKRGKHNAYYKFMVVADGAKIGSSKRGSRKGRNTVVDEARDKALQSTGAMAQKDAIDKTALYIQKKINKLSS